VPSRWKPGGASRTLSAAGALDGDERDVVALVVDLHVEGGGAVAQLLGHGLAVGGVRDHHVAVVAGAVDDQVVQDAAGAGEQHAVLRLVERERRQLAGEGVVERLAGLRADEHDLAHVRQVEEPGRGAHGVVLGEVAGVADRHLPAGEVGEGRARGGVGVVQRGGALHCAGLRVVGLAVLRAHEFSVRRPCRRDER
jgi:hypothetical protein